MSRRRLMPNRTSQRPTVATDTTCPRPRSSRAIWRAVHLSLRRHVSIWVTRSGSSWVGDRCGTLARSARPTSPSSSNRAFHFDKHWRETPASAATCAIGRCSQRRTRRPLPAGVNGALAWDMTGLLGSDELLALHILPTGTRPRLIAPRHQPHEPQHLGRAGPVWAVSGRVRQAVIHSRATHDGVPQARRPGRPRRRSPPDAGRAIPRPTRTAMPEPTLRARYSAQLVCVLSDAAAPLSTDLGEKRGWLLRADVPDIVQPFLT